MYALTELGRERRMNKQVKNKLRIYQEEESENATLKMQLERALEENHILMNQLEDKENICDAQEAETNFPKEIVAKHC